MAYRNRDELQSKMNARLVAALEVGAGVGRGRGVIPQGRGCGQRMGRGRGTGLGTPVGLNQPLGLNQYAYCKQEGHWKEECPLRPTGSQVIPISTAQSQQVPPLFGKLSESI